MIAILQTSFLLWKMDPDCQFIDDLPSNYTGKTRKSVRKVTGWECHGDITTNHTVGMVGDEYSLPTTIDGKLKSGGERGRFPGPSTIHDRWHFNFDKRKPKTVVKGVWQWRIAT